MEDGARPFCTSAGRIVSPGGSAAFLVWYDAVALRGDSRRERRGWATEDGRSL
jgi:hypothetical protein